MSTHMKHTPGPWVVDKKDGYVMSGNKVICETYNQADYRQVNQYEIPSIEEGKANAQLIASAPELKEALRALLDAQLDNVSNEQYSKAFDLAHKAIAKAEGKE